MVHHEIYAQIENSDLGDDAITTVRKSLLYSDNYAQVSKITMVNTAMVPTRSSQSNMFANLTS